MNKIPARLRMICGMALIASAAALAGCSQPASTSTSTETTAQPPMTSSTTTEMRRM